MYTVLSNVRHLIDLVPIKWFRVLPKTLDHQVVEHRFLY